MIAGFFYRELAIKSVPYTDSLLGGFLFTSFSSVALSPQGFFLRRLGGLYSHPISMLIGRTIMSGYPSEA